MPPKNSGKFLTGKQHLKFWSRVKIGSSNSCWEWDNPTHRFGYGMMRAAGALHGTHRLAYMDCVGPIPKGMVIRHKCDNPPCCNPNHLEIGTQADNLNDATERGRLDRGARYRKQWAQSIADKKAELALSPSPSTKEMTE